MNKKKILSRTLCMLTIVCFSAAIGIIGTIGVARSLAFKGCVYNDDKLEAIAYIIEREDDCEIVKISCDCEKGKAIMLAQPNNGKEPYLINLEVKEILPFTYEWAIVKE